MTCGLAMHNAGQDASWRAFERFHRNSQKVYDDASENPAETKLKSVALKCHSFHISTHSSLKLSHLYTSHVTDTYKRPAHTHTYNWTLKHTAFAGRFLSPKIYLVYFVCLLCIHICAPAQCSAFGDRERALESLNWCYRRLWAATWSLGTKFRSAARAANALFTESSLQPLLGTFKVGLIREFTKEKKHSIYSRALFLNTHCYFFSWRKEYFLNFSE